MKLRIAFALGCLLAFNLGAAAPDYEALKTDAEALFADGSFAKAGELYRQANPTNLPPAEQRWVQFRLADTQWRSQAATQTADPTKLDEARQQLEAFIREPGVAGREEDHDRVWAEVQESLGDFRWTRRNQQNWGEAWPHYQPALDWWAGTREIELARQRYLAMVWRMARPPGMDRGYSYGNWGNYVPLEVLDNALKIAQTDNDKAHAHYLIAMGIRNQGGDWERRARVPEEFEGAIKMGKATDWYDDALYNYAGWMANQGRSVRDKDGNWRQEPDYVKALELFRRFVTEFSKGETRYWEQAQQQIRNITDPQLGVSVANIFLPDSEIQYQLNWRNVKRIELTLFPVELNRDVKLSGQDERRRDWLQSIDLGGREKTKSWTRGTKDKGDYVPGGDAVHLDERLKPGAYVLEARGGGKDARELILVTDAAMVLKTSGRQALIYVCNALDGAPLGEARVKLWEGWWDTGSKWQWREAEKTADKDGIAVFDLEHPADRNLELFASAIRGDRQAFSSGNSNWPRGELEAWRIYAFTDRPAYRPRETVNWKFIARRYNGSVYSTPSDQTVEFDITDPRGAKVKSDKAKLNGFGSAWGTLELTEQMPLGEYRVAFWDSNRRNRIGDATLFRLEEYKLPEFKVTVQTPEEEVGTPGSGVHPKKAFRLGEQVELTIQADYYFGGSVANANVEVLVHQNPFWHSWRKSREFPWFYEDMDSSQSRWGRYYGGGQIIKRETLKTDATGKATLTFDTPANSGQDFEYRIEARVTDASRREITGSGTVRVTRQRYYVYPLAEHNLYRPQDKVRVDFKALDANEQPVRVEGTATVTRDYWYEIWLAPDGHEVKGDELKRHQAAGKIWPPPPERPDQKEWRLKFRGYEHDVILTQSLKTDTNGEATLTFMPEREGYYRIAWASEDTNSHLPTSISYPIRAETTVWVASSATTGLGYRHGGVEIIADQDTFRAGSEAPVMLVANSSDRYVLFTVEGEDLYHYRLVHMTGTVKLIDLFVEEKYVPNIFLGATLVSDRQVFTDTKQIIVPPTKNFLSVEVKPDRSQYQPRDEGTFTVTTKNDEGRPVSAEVAFGLVDESVFYIQSDYAGDPRQFYFGTKRDQRIQTQATMNQKSYAKLVLGENDRLIDERDTARQNAVERGRLRDEKSEEIETAESGAANDGFRGGALLGPVAMGGGGRMAMARSENMAFRGAPVAMPASIAPMGAQLPKAGNTAFSVMDQVQAETPAVQVRTDFRSTVFWQPDLKTDQNGQATVKVKYPDSLTGWKATARAATTGNQFGIAEGTTRTKQPLIVRLQAPRFFVVGDTVTVSAVVNNNTDQPMEVKVMLDVGGTGSPPTLILKNSKDAVERVPPNGEARADWTAEVKSPGEVNLKITGRGSKYADAMEKTCLAYEHGIEKFIAKSGKARFIASKQGGDAGNDVTVKLDLPKERKPGSTTLTVQVTPSLAVTMLDALPYLIDYPYGCTEQTMSRFLPAVITAKTLRDLGLKPEDVMGRVFGGIETNSADATHPKGRKDLAELDKITQAGLERLYDFQHSDGGWGWWKQGDSDHWMTAYVVWGLSLARDAKVGIKEDVLRRAAGFLGKTLVEEEENPDMQAWMLHALGVYSAPFKDNPGDLGRFIRKASDNLWNRRDQLNAYTRALFALSAHNLGDAARAKTLIQNLEDGVKRDDRPDTSVIISGNPSTLNSPAATERERGGQPSTTLGTAHWGEDGIYWRWSDGGVEATAFALRALLAMDPTNKLVEPVTNWLIKNRRGAQWNCTRDTAIVVLALNDYLKVSGELKSELEYELIVNGKTVATRKNSGADVFNAPSRFAVDPRLIRDSNEILIKTRRLGRASSRAGDTQAQPSDEARGDARPAQPALYFAVEAKFFSTEEPIAPAGNEIFVKREYYKLVGRPTLLKGYVYDRQPLGDGESVKSGERVEAVLTIEGKNNYEYLMFEDLKPAGLEAAEIRSGVSLYARELKSGAVAQRSGSPESRVPGPRPAPKSGAESRGSKAAGAALRTPRSALESDFTGRTRWVYQELRDRKVALFLDKLPEGVWEIRYELRAEVPGRFHALPVLGQAMYVPEIRCNGAEVRINVEEAK